MASVNSFFNPVFSLCSPCRSSDARAYETPRSLISRTASGLNSRVNLRLSMTHLRSHENT